MWHGHCSWQAQNAVRVGRVEGIAGNREVGIFDSGDVGASVSANKTVTQECEAKVSRKSVVSYKSVMQGLSNKHAVEESHTRVA